MRVSGNVPRTLLKNTWIPLVIVAVVATAGFTVYRFQGFFGKAETVRRGSDLASDSQPFNPKTVTYEIYGTEGAMATINYLDLDAQPRRVKDAVLPWSITLATTAPSASPNIIAQSDGDAIGCRITVDGDVKDENTSAGVNAQTFCLVKSA
jgi:hypothetical protein